MLSEFAVELLRKQPFVAALQPWQVDRLATMATEVSFEPDDVIFYEGEECSQFYLIVAGRVAVEITTPKRAFRIDTLAAGDELGWSSVLAGKGKYFQARALQPVRALKFDGAELIHHFQTDPARGALLIGFGLLSLLSNIYTEIDWGLIWPFAVIGFGALFFFAMFATGKSGAGFAIPGTIISGIGLVLLYPNLTGHWESMSYFWTFIVIFVGLGIYIMGWYGQDASQRKSGAGVMKVGFILLIIFGTIFETIFSSFDNLLFPILLILLGVRYLVLSRSGLINRKKDEPAADEPLPPAN